MVEAAHSLFVPACVYNNTKGDADHRVLEAFKEPAWNNPVVRIVGPDRVDLTPRIVNRWTVAALVDGMVRALERSKRPVPTWLRLFEQEEKSRARGLDTAIFGMG